MKKTTILAAAILLTLSLSFCSSQGSKKKHSEAVVYNHPELDALYKTPNEDLDRQPATKVQVPWVAGRPQDPNLRRQHDSKDDRPRNPETANTIENHESRARCSTPLNFIEFAPGNENAQGLSAQQAMKLMKDYGTITGYSQLDVEIIQSALGQIQAPEFALFEDSPKAQAYDLIFAYLSSMRNRDYATTQHGSYTDYTAGARLAVGLAAILRSHQASGGDLNCVRASITTVKQEFFNNNAGYFRGKAKPYLAMIDSLPIASATQWAKDGSIQKQLERTVAENRVIRLEIDRLHEELPRTYEAFKEALQEVPVCRSEIKISEATLAAVQNEAEFVKGLSQRCQAKVKKELDRVKKDETDLLGSFDRLESDLKRLNHSRSRGVSSSSIRDQVDRIERSLDRVSRALDKTQQQKVDYEHYMGLLTRFEGPESVQGGMRNLLSTVKERDDQLIRLGELRARHITLSLWESEPEDTLL